MVNQQFINHTDSPNLRVKQYELRTTDYSFIIGSSSAEAVRECRVRLGKDTGRGKGDVRAVTQNFCGENKRMLDKSIREIERERQGLQTQEKKLIAEIKKSAKQGQMGAVRIMAKDLIRTRHQIEKFYKLKSQLQGTLKSTQAMGEAMKGVTKAMGQMNKQMNLPSLQKIMQEFERQNERMELTSEVMGDAMDDALEGDEEEDETDELVNQVLDEIVAAPAATNKVAQAEPTTNDEGGIDDDLQARLDNLRRM
ncbi:Vacuolar protein sorting-associated protein 2-like protein 1 [Bienertia sinuspersici]